MNNVWTNEIDSILNIGRPLESIGVRNWGLEREAALKALEKLSTLGAAVLGGDVYVTSGSNVESNYDNWFCNRNPDETEGAFVNRSIAKAKSYIESYRTTDPVIFAIVPII